MKILLVVSDLIVGGITTSAFNFSNEMIERGHEVTFLDLSGTVEEKDLPNPEMKIARLNGKAKYWNITAKNSNGLSPILHKMLGLVKKITVRIGLWYKMIFTKFCPQEEFDVAIAFRQCEPCYYFVLNCVNAKKKIGFVHGELKFMGDISSWKKYMPQFTKIAYVSNAVKEQFVSAYPELSDNATAVYNMFNVEHIQKLSQENPAVEFDKTKKNIVTVCRIDNAFKRTNWIVEICEKLKKEASTSFHWYVLGDGVDYDNMVKLVKEKGVEDVLTFAGNQNNPYAIVKNADFTVLPSKSESFGLVVVESFILGVPVLVTEYPAAYEIIEENKNGIIAKQDLDDLYNKVKAMLDDENGKYSQCAEYMSTYTYNNDKPYSQFLSALEEYMNKPLISVIVPVYKAEFWLPKCVKSIIKQTFSDIEIILVDDGSPDGCPELCDKFAKKDERIRVIHKQNGGVSSARNIGINVSQGEYITFIDADDWLAPNALELLYKGIKDNEAQIVICEMQNITRRNNTIRRRINQSTVVDFNDSERITMEHLKNCAADGVIGKLYKASVIKDNAILFEQGVKFAEDLMFHLNCVRHCDRIALITGEVYMYNRLVYESASTRFYPEIADWMIKLAKTRFDVLSGKNINKNLFENYITYNSFEELFFMVMYCIQKCDNADIIKKMYERYFENVSKYFFNNTESEEKQKIYEYCKNSDYAGLYLYINKVLIVNNDSTFLTRLKKSLGKLYLKFRIIRYRCF